MVNWYICGKLRMGIYGTTTLSNTVTVTVRQYCSYSDSNVTTNVTQMSTINWTVLSVVSLGSESYLTPLNNSIKTLLPLLQIHATWFSTTLTNTVTVMVTEHHSHSWIPVLAVMVVYLTTLTNSTLNMTLFSPNSELSWSVPDGGLHGFTLCFHLADHEVTDELTILFLRFPQ